MGTWSKGVLATFVLFSMGAASAAAGPVRTEAGRVEGVRSGSLTVYKGIPFAAPPVGALRWRAPQPVAPWDGVRKADAFAPICLQNGVSVPGAAPERMSEDCLYLNVWTPAKRPNAKLPVMVWIYGGGWANGSASTPLYWGDKLAQKGVVVVNISYRVGSFGFLAHLELTRESESHSSGNYGLMDQIAALRWVRRNIAAFGGDPNNVTIFGQSAGSMSVSMLMASPLAKGLFHRAIGQSGGVFIPPEASPAANTFFLAGAEQRGERLASLLGAKTLQDLRGVAADQLLQKQGTSWHFILDGYVLPREPYDVFSEGRQHDVPLLLGSNADEGRMFLDGLTIRAASFTMDLQRQFGPLPAPLLVNYPASSDQQARTSRANLERDLRFGWDMWTWARLQARTGRGKVFYYHFAHTPPYPTDSPFADWGAGHGMEMRYVFGQLDQEPWQWSPFDRKLSEMMAAYWTNFAKRGDPNGKGLPEWPAYSEGRENVLYLAAPVSVQGVANRPALEVLDAIFSQARSARPKAATPP